MPLENFGKTHEIANLGTILYIQICIEGTDYSQSYNNAVFLANHFSPDALKLDVEKEGWRILEFNNVCERVFGQASLSAVKPR